MYCLTLRIISRSKDAWVMLNVWLQEYCTTCTGSGVVEGVKTVEVTIPAGWFLNASS